MEILIILFAVVVAYKIFEEGQRNMRINKKRQNFFVANFFTPHETYISADFHSAIALDKHNELIGLQDYSGRCNYYDSNYVIASELLIKERTSQRHPFINIWGRYIIGKWIFNNKIGEIAALTSKVTIEKDIESITIKVTVRDLSAPNYKIIFLEGNATKAAQVTALTQAEYWDSILKIFIDSRVAR